MVTWPSDPHFAVVLEAVSLRDNPFQPLPEVVKAEDVASEDSMPTNLRHTFHCPQACIGSDLVLVWALANPYVHTDGKKYPSTIVYVEKTVGSVRARWPMRYLKYLAGSSTSAPAPDLSSRDLAMQDHNYVFYSTVVRKFGPLSIWVASSEQLRSVSASLNGDSREWERRLLSAYHAEHGSFPLKNRRS